MIDIRAIRITWWLGSLLMLLLTVACASDSETDLRQQGSQLRLAGVTRADGDAERINEGNIRLFIAKAGTDNPASGSFTNNDAKDGWVNQGLSVDENTQYYMYGFMPAKLGNADIACGISAADGDYAKGANLTFTGLPVFTDQDICVVVGVRRVTGSTDKTKADEGSYGYLSGVSTANYLNLLMDHLYAKLEMSFNVESQYAELRQIHLKKVTLKSTYGESVSATVSLRSGSGLANRVSFGAFTSSAEKTTTPYKYQDGEAVTYLPVATTGTAAKALTPVYCAPCIFDGDGKYLSIQSTYDVYDRKGNKLAERTAENKIAVTGMAPGKSCQLKLTVEPTYLYILSDADLDNPAVKLTTE